MTKPTKLKLSNFVLMAEVPLENDPLLEREIDRQLRGDFPTDAKTAAQVLDLLDALDQAEANPPTVDKCLLDASSAINAGYARHVVTPGRMPTTGLPEQMAARLERLFGK